MLAACRPEPVLHFAADAAPAAGAVAGDTPLSQAVCDEGKCPALGEGKTSGGLCFDGVDDCLRVPWDQVFNTSSGFTVSVWLRPSMDTRMSAFNKFLGPAGDIYNSWQLFIESSKVSFRSWDGEIWDYLDSSRGLPLSTWSHVALVWNGTTKALYVDGEQIGTRQATIIFDQSDVYIGCELEAGGLATFFGGCIDEPALYDQALSNEQIAVLVLSALSE